MGSEIDDNKGLTVEEISDAKRPSTSINFTTRRNTATHNVSESLKNFLKSSQTELFVGTTLRDKLSNASTNKLHSDAFLNTDYSSLNLQ